MLDDLSDLYGAMRDRLTGDFERDLSEAGVGLQEFLETCARMAKDIASNDVFEVNVLTLRALQLGTAYGFFLGRDWTKRNE